MNNFNNRILSLFISVVMLFNLTAEVFAAPKFANQQEQNEIRNVLNDVYNASSPNTNSKEPTPKYNPAYYENRYQTTLENLTTKLDDLFELQDIMNNAIAAETAENTFYRDKNEIVSAQLTEYNELYTSYNNKIEILGGISEIERRYDLYKDYIDLKPAMEQLKAEQEDIIKVNQNKIDNENLNRKAYREAKKAITDAQALIQDYNENYFSKTDYFEQFKKDFDEITQTYSALEKKQNDINSQLEDIKNQEDITKQKKQDLLNLLPEEEGLTSDSDWDDIFELANRELDELSNETDLEMKALNNIEKAQSIAYEKYLDSKVDNVLLPATLNICSKYSAIADAYHKEGGNFMGQIRGHNAKTAPGTVVRTVNDLMTADALPSEYWKKQKTAWRHCINTSWDEKGLQEYNLDITMEEFADIKYGEYLVTYKLGENENISDQEEKRISESLARHTIGLAFLNTDSAIAHYYQVIGDLRQTYHLAKYLRKDWAKKGYGTFSDERLIFDDDGDSKWTKCEFTPNENSKDTSLSDYYTNRYIIFSNVHNIGVQYKRDLNSLLIKIMNFISESTQKSNLRAYLKNDLKIDLDTIYHELEIAAKNDPTLDIDMEKVTKNFNEIGIRYTQESKEEFVNIKIQKAPFDPLMFLLGPSHLIDRNREVVRARRDALNSFDLNYSQAIRDILYFNTVTDTDEKNFDAWNNVALRASEAERLLKYMLSLGALKTDKYTGVRGETVTYETYPDRMLTDLIGSRHEETKDLIFDIIITLPFACMEGILNFVRIIGKPTLRSLLKAGVKVAARSALKQTSKMIARQSATVGKIGSRRVLKNTKAIRNVLQNKSFIPTSKNLIARDNVRMATARKFAPRFINKTRATLTHMTPQTLPSRILEDIHISRTAAPGTSKIFNADLTKRQYEQFSKQLDEVMHSRKTVKPEKTVPQVQSAKAAKKPSRALQGIRQKVAIALTSFSLVFNPINVEKIFANTAKSEIENAASATVKQETKKGITKRADAWISDVQREALVMEEKRTVSSKSKPKTKIGAGDGDPGLNSTGIYTPSDVVKKGRGNKYLIDKTKLTNAAAKRNKHISKFSKGNAVQKAHKYQKVDKNFVRNVKNGTVSPIGKITQKETTINAQKSIDATITTYQEQGAIVYEGDLKTAIANEATEGGLLENVAIPEKLNKDTWNTFYENLNKAIAAGNTKAKQFFDRHMSNILEPNKMVVFNERMNIPGLKPYSKTAMSAEKAIAAQSDKNIMVITDRGLTAVNSHSLDLGGNINKLMKGAVSAVFERKDGRLFVVIEWDERNRPICAVLESDTKKGVNVVVTNYRIDRPNRILKELSRENLRKAFYVDQQSADIINALATH